MRQKRYHRKTDREDDGLPPPTAPKQQYSTDHIIVSKSSSDQKRLAADGEVATHTVRDTYSGILYAVALTARSTQKLLKSFKFATGPAVRNPNVIMKSDAEAGIIEAVELLG